MYLSLSFSLISYFSFYFFFLHLSENSSDSTYFTTPRLLLLLLDLLRSKIIKYLIYKVNISQISNSSLSQMPPPQVNSEIDCPRRAGWPHLSTSHVMRDTIFFCYECIIESMTLWLQAGERNGFPTPFQIKCAQNIHLCPLCPKCGPCDRSRLKCISVSWILKQSSWNLELTLEYRFQLDLSNIDLSFYHFLHGSWVFGRSFKRLLDVKDLSSVQKLVRSLQQRLTTW